MLISSRDECIKPGGLNVAGDVARHVSPVGGGEGVWTGTSKNFGTLITEYLCVFF